MKKEVYVVKGMSCAGCGKSIEMSLRSLPGVGEVQAKLDEATVEIAYDPAVITIDAIKTAIAKLGYALTDMRPAYGQREGSDEAIG